MQTVIQWEGLEVEATCPTHMWVDVLGALGNEMLRLNAALSVVVGDSEPAQAVIDSADARVQSFSADLKSDDPAPADDNA